MTSSFTSRLPLSRSEVDRDHLFREGEHVFETLWADPATRVLPLWRGSALLEAPARLRLLTPADVPRDGVLVYLGRTTVDRGMPVGTPIVAAVLDDATAERLSGEWGNLRALGTKLDDLDAGIFTEALAMANWHAAHPFSPRTGTATRSSKGGWVRVDPTDASEHFPRTDPAIIVGVVDGQDRLLLGSNALWESNRYSLLAGFVEPGESLEAAVAREVYEEARVRVVEPRYLGSQPWPFPASLMLGFLARVDPSFEGTATADGTEILDVRWFSREEIASHLGTIVLPGRASIARAIIEEWYGGPIEDGIDW